MIPNKTKSKETISAEGNEKYGSFAFFDPIHFF